MAMETSQAVSTSLTASVIREDQAVGFDMVDLEDESSNHPEQNEHRQDSTGLRSEHK
jgi:hypothetical protein